MEVLRCPGCGGPKILPAQVLSGEGNAIFLYPAGASSVRWDLGVALSGGFHCCLNCGLVWNRLNPEQIQEFLGNHGTELGKQYLETVLKGPYHDLPDDPGARQAADRATEIDALLVSWRDGAATRRYREMTGKTWDQALNDIKHWRKYPRAMKLALFGWPPEEKRQDKGREGRTHPMRDPWLDG